MHKASPETQETKCLTWVTKHALRHAASQASPHTSRQWRFLWGFRRRVSSWGWYKAQRILQEATGQTEHGNSPAAWKYWLRLHEPFPLFYDVAATCLGLRPPQWGWTVVGPEPLTTVPLHWPQMGIFSLPICKFSQLRIKVHLYLISKGFFLVLP